MLLILFPYKFTKFYNYLLDVKNLENKLNCKVEVHDLSNIVNKGWNKSFLTKKSNNCLSFKNLIDWQLRFNHLRRDKNLTIFNFLDLNTFNSLAVHFILNKSKSKIIRLASSGVIEHNYYYKKNIFNYINQILKGKIFFSKFLYIFKSKFLHLVYRSFFPLDEILLITGPKKQTITNLGTKKYEINFHSLDYSKAIQNIKFNKKKNYIVYFDSPSPFFKDDTETIYQNNNFSANVEKIKEHYNKLNLFLSSIEKIYSHKVIIVPHPKVKKIKNPFYSKKFKIANEINTAEYLINYCKFIICASPSTVVAYAIKNYKPILLLEGNGFKNLESAKVDNYLGVKVMKNYLDCSKINYEIILKKKIAFKVDKKKYDKYKYNFLTSENISELANYQIIQKIINESKYSAK